MYNAVHMIPVTSRVFISASAIWPKQTTGTGRELVELPNLPRSSPDRPEFRQTGLALPTTKAASVGGLFQPPPGRAALIGPLDALAVVIPSASEWVIGLFGAPMSVIDVLTPTDLIVLNIH
jgi:hypothetical protein